MGDAAINDQIGFGLPDNFLECDNVSRFLNNGSAKVFEIVGVVILNDPVMKLSGQIL